MKPIALALWTRFRVIAHYWLRWKIVLRSKAFDVWCNCPTLIVQNYREAGRNRRIIVSRTVTSAWYRSNLQLKRKPFKRLGELVINSTFHCLLMLMASIYISRSFIVRQVALDIFKRHWRRGRLDLGVDQTTLVPMGLRNVTHSENRVH